MINYWRKCMHQYVDFSGRARRSEYWYFVLFNVIIAIILGLISGLLGLTYQNEPILSNIYALIILLPSIAVLVRRLHDTGRSGWWILIQLIPIIGAIVILVFTIQDSKPETNKWGPNPKHQGSADIE